MVMRGDEIRDRRNSPVDWARLNPLLAAGEHGYEIGTGKFKIGNGHSRWNELEYFVAEPGVRNAINTAIGDVFPDSDAGRTVITDHINSETPHPVYDEGPSFLLLYENAKV